MAKDQNIQINPAKISGSCGRLLCCLKFEQEAYEDLARNTPAVDSMVETPNGKARVLDAHLLSGRIKVLMDNPNEHEIKTFHKSELKYKVTGGNHGADPRPYKKEDRAGLKSEEPVQKQGLPGLPVREFGGVKACGCGNCQGCCGQNGPVTSEEEPLTKATLPPQRRGGRRRR